MPGSPYIEKPPPGLLTWPALLRMFGPPTVAFLAACWYSGVLFEALVIMTVTLVFIAWWRR
ncbi:hypothetical protein [Candidatus Poseidonia alphae]|uniref:hypothetical protein n=1 Tax=Candidatus Poseidonia alphae TaxID=1915863 RepID=UPI0030C665BC